MAQERGALHHLSALLSISLLGLRAAYQPSLSEGYYP